MKHKSAILILIALLFISLGFNAAYIYASWQTRTYALLMLANAQTAHLEGNADKAIDFAYKALADENNSFISASLIGDIYYCFGENSAAVLNYGIASRSTDSSGSKKLLQNNIDLIEGKNAAPRTLPKCHESYGHR